MDRYKQKNENELIVELWDAKEQQPIFRNYAITIVGNDKTIKANIKKHIREQN